MKKGHITPDVNRGRIAVEGMGNWWFFVMDIKHILMPFSFFNRPISLYEIDDKGIQLPADDPHPFLHSMDRIGILGPLSVVTMPLLSLITLKHAHPIVNIIIMISVGLTVTLLVYRRNGLKKVQVFKKRRAIIHADRSEVIARSVMGTFLFWFLLFFFVVEIFDNNLLAEFFAGLLLALVLHTYDLSAFNVGDVQVEFLDEEESKDKPELGE